MVRKLIRQMLTAQIFSALTVSLCLLIDNIMIGRYLGEEAMAAYGLANPILLAVGAIGSLLAAGVQVACSRSLGRGSKQETDAGFTTAIVLTLGISALFTTAVLIFRSPLATALGAGGSGTLFDQTRDYLAGFIIGAPASMGALILVPFLQMAGQSGLLIAAVLSMTLADVALDLVNVFIFHGGMFGMGLASSLSYYLALLVGCFYFLSGKCVFRFSWKLVTPRKIAELFRGGVPAGFNMASSVILVYVLNRILKGAGGSAALAAYTVVSALGNASNCITTGIGGVSLTLAGIFYNEEDRTSLMELLRSLARYAVILGLAMGAALLVFAPALVSLFLPKGGETAEMAVLGLRIFAAGLIPCCLNNALKYAYQATERTALSEVYALAEGALFPALAAFVLSRIWGVTGVWLYFVAGELLTLLCAGVYIRLRSGRSPWRDGAYLLLRKDFGAVEGQLMEADIGSMEDVVTVAREAERFCQRNGQSTKRSGEIGLCIEEMASNTVQHGFAQDRRPHHLSVRVLRKETHWVLRFRDDCTAFDPVHYVPDAGKDALGLQLVLSIAEEASYTYSLNMNNLTLRLPAGD